MPQGNATPQAAALRTETVGIQTVVRDLNQNGGSNPGDLWHAASNVQAGSGAQTIYINCTAGFVTPQGPSVPAGEPYWAFTASSTEADGNNFVIQHDDGTDNATNNTFEVYSMKAQATFMRVGQVTSTGMTSNQTSFYSHITGTTHIRAGQITNSDLSGGVIAEASLSQGSFTIVNSIAGSAGVAAYSAKWVNCNTLTTTGTIHLFFPSGTTISSSSWGSLIIDSGTYTYNAQITAIGGTTITWTSGAASRTPVTEQVQNSTDGGTTWVNVGGATTSPATITRGAAQYRVKSTDAASVVVYSPTSTYTLPPTDSNAQKLYLLGYFG
jgi:hypothetical protein